MEKRATINKFLEKRRSGWGQRDVLHTPLLKIVFKICLIIIADDKIFKVIGSKIKIFKNYKGSMINLLAEIKSQWLFIFALAQVISLLVITYEFFHIWKAQCKLDKINRDIYRIGFSISLLILSTIGSLFIYFNILSTANSILIWGAITIFLPILIGAILSLVVK